MRRGLDERELRALVAAVECQAREDLAAQVRGADAVPGEPEAVVDAATAPEDRQVRGGDVDRPAPGMRHLTAAGLREEARQALTRRRDDVAVELESVRGAASDAHRAAAPAEHDPAVAGRPCVVDECPAVHDRLAVRPAELLQDVGNRLGEDDVARGHGE